MSESFVVSSSGGAVTGGSGFDVLDKVIKYTGPGFLTTLNDVAVSKASQNTMVRVAVGVLIVGLILLMWFAVVNGFYAWRMGVTFVSPDAADQGYTSKYPFGRGAASARDVRFGGPIGITGDVQGMTNKKYDTMTNKKFDTFLNGSEPPVFQDVPNYILRKENRMQAALHAYSKLRSKKGQGAVPDWAEYWKDWQAEGGYNYGGAQIYDQSELRENATKVTQGMALRNKPY
jgi:hypothetical protein